MIFGGPRTATILVCHCHVWSAAPSPSPYTSLSPSSAPQDFKALLCVGLGQEIGIGCASGQVGVEYRQGSAAGGGETTTDAV